MWIPLKAVHLNARNIWKLKVTGADVEVHTTIPDASAPNGYVTELFSFANHALAVEARDDFIEATSRQRKQF